MGARSPEHSPTLRASSRRRSQPAELYFSEQPGTPPLPSLVLAAVAALDPDLHKDLLRNVSRAPPPDLHKDLLRNVLRAPPPDLHKHLLRNVPRAPPLDLHKDLLRNVQSRAPLRAHTARTPRALRAHSALRALTARSDPPTLRRSDPPTQVVLTGGGACLVGMPERLEGELRIKTSRYRSAPTIMNQVCPRPCARRSRPPLRRRFRAVPGGSRRFQAGPCVTRGPPAPPPQAQRIVIHGGSGVERRTSAWLGGSILGSMGSHHEIWTSRAEYEEHGLILRKGLSAFA